MGGLYTRGLWLLLCAASLSACAATAKDNLAQDQHIWQEDKEPYGFYRSISYTLLRTHQYMKATRAIQEMAKRKPESPEPDTLMARAHIGMKQFEAAERSLKQALEKDEDFTPAHAQFGVMLNTLGNHRRADRHHRRAIALEPDVADHQNNLGFSQYLQARFREAIGSYARALELDASARRIHNNIAFAYGKLGNLDKAYQHFQLAGVPAQASNNMGFLFEQGGKLERAYDYYLIAVEQDPELLPARNNLERVCRQLGRPVPEVAVRSRKPPEGLEPPETTHQTTPETPDAAEPATPET